MKKSVFGFLVGSSITFIISAVLFRKEKAKTKEEYAKAAEDALIQDALIQVIKAYDAGVEAGKNAV